VKRKNRFCKRN